MAKRADLTAELVRQLLDYDPLTGRFRWRERPAWMFPAEKYQRAWNKKFAHKDAGSLAKTGYLTIAIFGRAYLAHRLAWLWMTGEWPSEQIDHLSLARSENHWENLRPASNQQNNSNKRAHPRNVTGFKGVGWHKKTKKFRARIMVNGHETHLGMFATAEEAHTAYRKAAEQMFGDFSRAA